MKPWYKSVTIWVNIAVLVLTFLGELFKLIPEAASLVGYITTMLNLALRLKTASGIVMK